MKREQRIVLGIVALIAGVVLLALWLVLDDGDGSTGGSDGGDPVVQGGGQDGTGSSGDAPKAPERGPGELTGRVLMRNDGSPAAGRTVRLFTRGTDPIEVTTDERGAFRFAGLSRKAAFRLEVNAEDDGYISIPGIRLRRHRRRDLGDVWLAPTSRVVVVVRSSTGEALKGAQVLGYRLGQGVEGFTADDPPVAAATSKADAKGEAAFPRLSVGSWNFVATHKGHARRATGEWALQAGAGERRFEITLDRGASLHGRVTDPDGEPVRGLLVLAIRRTLPRTAASAPLAQRVWTDDDGRYGFDSLPAADMVLWTSRDEGPLSVAAAVRIPGVESFDFVVGHDAILRGTITDEETGMGVSGAEVTAVLQRDDRIPVNAHDTTDNHGAYELRFPDSGSLVKFELESAAHVLGSGATVGTRLVQGTVTVTDLTASRAATVEGHVTGPGGPVVGALVSAGGRVTTTDTDGAYSLGGIQGTSAVISASRWGYGTRSDTVPVSPGERRMHDLVLAPGEPLYGVVVDPDGNGVPDAEVYIVGHGDGRRTTTDGEGAFEFPSASPGATVTLATKSPLHAPGSAQVTVRGALTGGPPITVARIVVQPLVKVTGRVVSRSGEPLVDAYVQVAGWSGGGAIDPIHLEWSWLTFERWSVKADGTFEHLAPIVDRGFVVRAGARGHAPVMSAHVPIVPGRTEYDVALRLDGGHRLSGTVRDTDGRPVAGASVSIVGRPAGEEGSSWKYPGAIGAPAAAVSGPDGSFRILHLPEGNYGVEAKRSGHTAARALVRVPGGGDANLRLAVILRVSGRILTPTGRGVGDVQLVLRSESGDTVAVRTDAAGRFAAAVPSAGRYEVGLEDGRSAGTIQAGETGRTLRVK